MLKTIAASSNTKILPLNNKENLHDNITLPLGRTSAPLADSIKNYDISNINMLFVRLLQDDTTSIRKPRLTRHEGFFIDCIVQYNPWTHHFRTGKSIGADVTPVFDNETTKKHTNRIERYGITDDIEWINYIVTYRRKTTCQNSAKNEHPIAPHDESIHFTGGSSNPTGVSRERRLFLTQLHIVVDDSPGEQWKQCVSGTVNCPCGP